MRGVFRSLALIGLLTFSLPIQAQSADPLQFIPPVADLVVKIEKPRELLESVFKLPITDQALNLKFTQRLLDTADFRKFLELVRYFEMETGKPWPELVDSLAGGGIALGVKYNDSSYADPPTLLVVQAKDEEVLKKFVATSFEIAKAEQERQNGASKVEVKSEDGFDNYKIDDNFFVSRTGSVLLFAPKAEIIKLAVEHAKKVKADSKTVSMATQAGPKAAKKLLGGRPDAWLWFNLDWVKALPDAKGLFEQPRNDFAQTFAFAGWLDVARRSSFIAAGLTAKPDGYEFQIRLPAGLDNRGADTVLHLPQDKAEPQVMPALQPKNTIVSHSYYLDWKAIYSESDKIYNKEVSKQLAEGEKQLSRFLPGASLAKLLAGTGVYNQIVFAHSDKSPYKTLPGQRIPPGAYILSMRNPDGGKDIEALVRGVGFFLSTQAPLKMTEETHNGVKMLIYRFDEEKPFPGGDPNNIRFNFAPTFADCGDRLIFSSTTDLCKELIDLAKKPATHAKAAGYENMALQFFAKGIASQINTDPQALMVQLILNQALREDEARKEAGLLVDYLRNLGVLKINTVYKPNSFEFKFRWTIK